MPSRSFNRNHEHGISDNVRQRHGHNEIQSGDEALATFFFAAQQPTLARLGAATVNLEVGDIGDNEADIEEEEKEVANYFRRRIVWRLPAW